MKIKPGDFVTIINAWRPETTSLHLVIYLCESPWNNADEFPGRIVCIFPPWHGSSTVCEHYTKKVHK